MLEQEQQEHQSLGEQRTVYRRTPYQLAGFWVRLFAYLFDVGIIFGASFVFVRFPLSLLGIELMFTILFFTASFVGLFGSLYFVLMTKTWGQTLGKMVMAIQVINRNGKPLSWSNVFFREFIGRFLSQLFGLHLGYIWIAFHPQKQGWHDLIDNTQVVYDRDATRKLQIEV